MIPRSLWDAVNTMQPNLKEVKVDFSAYSQVILFVHIFCSLVTIFFWRNKSHRSFIGNIGGNMVMMNLVSFSKGY